MAVEKTDFKGGTTVFDAKPAIVNKTLDADYYQSRQAMTAARRAKGRPAPEDIERHKLIAADMRAHPIPVVMRKWSISRNVIDKIRGEMSLGKL